MPKDVNYWAAVWSARGAQIYYASVNPVWANSYGMTEEHIKLFNDRLKGQLIPEIIWLDSHDYLMSVRCPAASDGVHYKGRYQSRMYQYYLSMIGAGDLRTHDCGGVQGFEKQVRGHKGMGNDCSFSHAFLAKLPYNRNL